MTDTCKLCGAMPDDYDHPIVECSECHAEICGECLNHKADDIGLVLCRSCFDRLCETCPECEGSGDAEYDPSGAFSLDCLLCDGDGFIAKRKEARP